MALADVVQKKQVMQFHHMMLRCKSHECLVMICMIHQCLFLLIYFTYSKPVTQSNCAC